MSPFLTRRTLLRTMNIGLAGLALGCFDKKPPKATPPKEEEPAKDLPKGEGLRPNVFVHLEPDGTLNIVCHRSEMGQGVRSTLPLLIADELGADPSRIKVIQGEGNKAYGDQNTDGSSSVRLIYDKMRLMGAGARVLLLEAAAAHWMVPSSECFAERHRVIHKGSGREIEFGALAEAASRLKLPEHIPLRPERELKHVFRPMPLIDAPDFVTGKAQFGADLSLPGMLVAVIARPPVVGGRAVKFDSSKALEVKGVQRVVQLPDIKAPWGFQPLGGVAVIATHTWAALQGRQALDITWEHGENERYDSGKYKETLSEAVKKPGKVLRKVGNVEAALLKAARRHESEYHLPHLPHEPMEPPVALARVDEERCEVWAPTQNPQAAQTALAQALGLSEDKITVHVTFLGGGFGRKSKPDYCVEAALLARETGVPVRVQWTREDDIRHDYLNTVATVRLSAGLDKAGKVQAWRHRSAFPPIATLFGGPALPSGGDLQQGVFDLALDVPHLSAEVAEAKAHTRIGWLRAVYNLFQAYAVGSFVDELAYLKGSDPKDTWLELLGPARKASLSELGLEELKNYGQSLEQHPVDVGRLRGVIEAVTKDARWAERKTDGRSLGLAAHRSFLSYAAAVVSVVKKPEGTLAVDEVWIAFDAGKIVNPDRARAQMEGAAIFAMSYALYGGITFKKGAVEQSTFLEGGRLVRMNEAPRKTHVTLIESSAAPGGVGEPGVPPIAPAIANAVFALTGTRVRELPLIGRLKV